MMENYQNYTLFYKFIEEYESTGFDSIDVNDPLMLALEQMMENNNQYFFIADLFQSKILFTSKKSIDLIGIKPSEVNPYHSIEAAHPDEVCRNIKGWAKLLDLGNTILKNQKDNALLSANMKVRNPKGNYSEILFQCYLFYSEIPHKTVYAIQIHTNIDNFKMRKQGYHYYVGNDLSNFKYPDDELLKKGNDFTKREFEIIKLIESGMSSEQIADKLFLSHYTINAHRSNILKKTDKAHVSELIYDLSEKGIL